MPAVLFVCVSSVLVAIAESSEVCYEELGCFADDEAFHDARYRPWSALPQSREVVNTTFLMYNGRSPSGAGTLSWNSTEDQVRRSRFDPSIGTKVLIFGFCNQPDADNWVMKTKDAYLKVGEYNVIIVDWHGGNGMPYTRAVANTRLVGAEVALLLSKLQRALGADPMKVHVLGHSLGAHVSGYAGERTKTLGRITGLDPAEPFFQGMPPRVRLDPTDADFVDVIHTDGGAFLRNIWLNQGMGMEQPAGHVDFYPNGGSSMPGCDMLSRIVEFFEGLAEGHLRVFSCNHERATSYMVDSIGNSRCMPLAFACETYEDFMAGKCFHCGSDGSRCAVMGEHADQWKKFKKDGAVQHMYTMTNDNPPFCAFLYRITATFGHFLSGNVTGRARLYLRLSGQRGSAVLPVTRRTTEFMAGTTYSFVVHTDEDVGDIRQVGFKVESFPFLYANTLPLSGVTVTPMTAPRLESDVPSSTMRMCPPSNETDLVEGFITMRSCS